jgi:cytochrome c-type biogenesis protein
VSSVASVIDGGSLLLAVPVALAAGAVSFASPCVLPLVPGYLSYVTGMSGAEADDAAAAEARRRKRWRTVAGAGLFVLGFTAVFVSMGAAFGEIGTNLLVHQKLLEQIFGSLMILMGLFFAGVFPERWGGLLQRDARIRYRPTVGIGWTPCLGPTLTAVQSLAITQSSAGRGAFLSAAYCVGLGLPFILTAVAFRRAMTAFGWIKRHYGAVTRIGGGMLVVVGAAMVSGVWDHLIHLMQGWVAGFNLPL